ncbi:MAG: fluoride efflux transporter FluC [Coraliomargaritaceae bacterium]
MSVRAFSLVAVGSGLGAVLRFSLGQVFVSGRGVAFPVATLLVNLLGCLLVGLLAGRWVAKEGVPAVSGRWHFWITGVCGGFTTFSALSSEVLWMTLEGRGPFAGLYAAASIGLGLFAVWAGLSYSMTSRARAVESSEGVNG